MAAPFALFVRENLRTWLRARGFWMVLVAALVPPLLTSAWVFTHQADVATVEITWSPESPDAGDNVTITAGVVNRHDSATGPFNVTIRVGFYQGTAGGETTFQARTNQSVAVDDLAAGERRDVSVTWTAEAGTWLVEAIADADEAIAEIEELNNPRQAQMVVQSPAVELEVPSFPEAQNASLPQADLAVTSLEWEPAELFQNDAATVTVGVRNDGPEDVTNVTLRLAVHRATGQTFSPFPSPDLSRTLSVAAGSTANETFTWNPTQVGQYALVASAVPGTTFSDNDTSDNFLGRQTFIDRKLVFEEPEEKATAKDFYRNVLELLHLKLLIPLIGLFYAAGVLADEREKGNLTYLLTRPVPRWMLPVARFSVSFIVAGIAIVAGILLTYFLLLGLPQAAPGFLYWPLLFSLVALLVYGAAATFVGVAFQRPYLVGLLYVLGWEALILLGRNVLVNGRPLLQDWVLWFSLNDWVGRAFAGWDPDQGAQWLPAGSEARTAFAVILGVAVVALAASVWWMKKREFET